MDDSLIEAAKQYSAESAKSVSKIVADLFAIIKTKETQNKKHELTPTVLAFKGILRGKKISEDD